MIDPTSQRIIYEQKERELLNAIELKRRIAEADACPRSQRPWYVRLEKKLSRPLSGKPAVEHCYSCCV